MGLTEKLWYKLKRKHKLASSTETDVWLWTHKILKIDNTKASLIISSSLQVSRMLVIWQTAKEEHDYSRQQEKIHALIITWEELI